MKQIFDYEKRVQWHIQQILKIVLDVQFVITVNNYLVSKYQSLNNQIKIKQKQISFLKIQPQELISIIHQNCFFITNQSNLINKSLINNIVQQINHENGNKGYILLLQYKNFMYHHMIEKHNRRKFLTPKKFKLSSSPINNKSGQNNSNKLGQNSNKSGGNSSKSGGYIKQPLSMRQSMSIKQVDQQSQGMGRSNNKFESSQILRQNNNRFESTQVLRQNNQLLQKNGNNCQICKYNNSQLIRYNNIQMTNQKQDKNDEYKLEEYSKIKIDNEYKIQQKKQQYEIKQQQISNKQINKQQQSNNQQISNKIQKKTDNNKPYISSIIQIKQNNKCNQTQQQININIFKSILINSIQSLISIQKSNQQPQQINHIIHNQFLSIIKSIIRNHLTNLNQKCIKKILNHIHSISLSNTIDNHQIIILTIKLIAQQNFKLFHDSIIKNTSQKGKFTLSPSQLNTLLSSTYLQLIHKSNCQPTKIIQNLTQFIIQTTTRPFTFKDYLIFIQKLTSINQL